MILNAPASVYYTRTSNFIFFNDDAVPIPYIGIGSAAFLLGFGLMEWIMSTNSNLDISSEQMSCGNQNVYKIEGEFLESSVTLFYRINYNNVHIMVRKFWGFICRTVENYANSRK